MRFIRLQLVFLAILTAASQVNADPMTLKQLAESLRSYEQIYRYREEQIVRDNVNRFTQPELVAKYPPPGGLTIHLSSKKTAHSVLQSPGVYWAAASYEHHGSDGSVTTSAHRVTSDGNKLLGIYDQNAYLKGEPPALAAGYSQGPHMYIFEGWGLDDELSDNLWGKTPKDWSWQIKGDEAVSGLSCIRLDYEQKGNDGVVYGLGSVWLAWDKNLLPVRLVGRRAYTSMPDVPTHEVNCTQFREIESGVWYPDTIIGKAFHGPAYVEMGKKFPSIDSLLRVEKVTLNPSYPLEYFQDFEIPDGVHVKEIDRPGGKIIREYTTGEPASSALIDRRLFVPLLLGLTIVVLVCIRYRMNRSQAR